MGHSTPVKEQWPVNRLVFEFAYGLRALAQRNTMQVEERNSCHAQQMDKNA